MVAKEIITRDDRDAIKAHRTRKKQVDIFCDLFLKKDDKYFDILISTLKSNKQGHIADLLWPIKDSGSATAQVAPQGGAFQGGYGTSNATYCFHM